MSKVQTDNSYLEEKIMLRVQSIAGIGKDEIRVLEAFGGNGVMWDEVEVRTGKKITRLRIDKKKDRKGIYLVGDNLKFLKELDLFSFDVIDLDAYGSPYKQLKILFEKGYSGVVHCTFIQSGLGNLDKGLLVSFGYTKEMLKKCPTLFNRKGMEIMEHWLHQNGVLSITGCFFGRKRYFYFHK